MSIAAPIQRYNDPRLNGSSRAAPFLKACYQFRSSSALTDKVGAIFKMCAETPVAILGRAHQIAHYHSLSPEERAHPRSIEVGGLALPELKPAKGSQQELYLGGSGEKIKAILACGFNTKKTRKSAILSDGVYLTPNQETARVYGKEQIVVSLDVLPGEIAYLDPTALAHFQFEHRKLLVAHKGYDELPSLFLQNGYKGIEYDLFDWKRGVRAQRALVVYDPACISITTVESVE